MVCRFVGPQMMVVGRNIHELVVLDAQGVLVSLDLQPVVKCGNQVRNLDFYKLTNH